MADTFGNQNGVGLFNHIPGGCNVLFLDGHVEFIRYLSTDAEPGSGTEPIVGTVANVLGLF